MKKGMLLRISLFICIALCLSVSISNAAPNRTDRAFMFYADLNSAPGDLTGAHGSPADHIDMWLSFMNYGNRKVTNIKFKFYDGQGNNITIGGNYYAYPDEIPAHGSLFLSVNQLVQNYSNSKLCSMEIIWDTAGDIKSQVTLIGTIKDVNGNFLQQMIFPLYSPN
jgi:hypothetical protein